MAAPRQAYRRPQSAAPLTRTFPHLRASDDKMIRLASVVAVAGLALGGCTEGSERTGPTTTAATEAATQSAATQTAAPQPTPALKAVDLRYGVYLARIEIHTTITPDGSLRSVRTDNKSYGPDDIDPKNEHRVTRQGRLTPEQIADLASMFVGWESLSEDRYGGVADGGDIQLRYGDRTVSGGSETPKQVWDILGRISELVSKMPVVVD